MSTAAAQTVAMSGEYGVSEGRILNLPLNAPRLPCTNVRHARCHQGTVNGSVDPLAEQASGVGVPGAGVRVIPGALGVGDPFTIPTAAFLQRAAHRYTPLPTAGERNRAIVQADTTLSYRMPAPKRAVDPPLNTRMFQANAWNAAGNGQTGRVAANTTPISTQTQALHDITLRYRAGPNQFGGTMASLLDGEGRLYGVITTTRTLPPPISLPFVGTIPLDDGVPGNPRTTQGAGWSYTVMDGVKPGVIRNFGGLATPCTTWTPPGPSGCGLVTNVGITPIVVIPGATSTRHVFAWTTGTVEVLLAGTTGGLPNDQLLTAMGYDTTSMTHGGGTVRNIGLVAGSFAIRNSVAGGLSKPWIVGLDMQFTPEPAHTASLLAGLGMLVCLMHRRRRV